MPQVAEPPEAATAASRYPATRRHPEHRHHHDPVSAGDHPSFDGKWARHCAFGTTVAGIVVLVAAWLVPIQQATVPLLSGGAGTVSLGILGLLIQWRRASTADLDEVLVFVDEELADENDERRVLNTDRSREADWEGLLSVQDERLLQRIEQSLAAPDGFAESHRWQQVVESLSDGICLTDGDGQVLEATPAFAALLRCDSDNDLIGSLLPDALRNVSTTAASELAGRVERGSRRFSLEIFCGDNIEDGVMRLCRTPLRDESDQKTGVWSLRDITHQKLSDEARNRFVATATHELRTPLTNLKAYAETLVLADDIEVEQQKEFCNIINAEATRLSRFVDELLNLSRMDGGEMSVTRSETDFGRLINETVEHVRPQFDQKSQRFDVSIPPKFPRMCIDKDSVAAAMVNLLGNACKYTPDGGLIRLQIELQDDSIQLHVEDSGIGIAADEVRQIFDRFFRSSDARVREVEGTGLGLAYVREVARLHGGQLSVHSELDSGSRFTLSLPVTQ